MFLIENSPPKRLILSQLPMTKEIKIAASKINTSKANNAVVCLNNDSIHV